MNKSAGKRLHMGCGEGLGSRKAESTPVSAVRRKSNHWPIVPRKTRKRKGGEDR